MKLTIRTRVNVGRSVKGIYTPEHTVEISAEDVDPSEIDLCRDMILVNSDRLQAEVTKRYPLVREEN